MKPFFFKLLSWEFCYFAQYMGMYQLTKLTQSERSYLLFNLNCNEVNKVKLHPKTLQQRVKQSGQSHDNIMTLIFQGHFISSKPFSGPVLAQRRLPKCTQRRTQNLGKTVFAKNLILDFWLGSEYASDIAPRQFPLSREIFLILFNLLWLRFLFNSFMT